MRGSRWLDAEDARALAALDAAPEFLFRRQKKVLIERIGWYLDLDPLAAAGDNREHRGGGIGDPHVVLELGHVLLRRCLLRERPRQHEFRFEHCAGAFDHAVQRRRHPAEHRVAHPALDIFDHLPGRALVPLPVQGFGREPELDERLPDRSSGSASPRFSRQRRCRAASSLPMMIRASEPPIKVRLLRESAILMGVVIANSYT